jgi:fructoselysine 6-kinase
MPGAEVATVGDNCIDRYGAPVNRSFVGGNAVNVAVQLARLGRRTAYFGAVADDSDGRRTGASLLSRGVDITGLRTVPGVTAYTDIAFAENGERVFVFEEFGVCRGYRPDESDVTRLMTMRHVHLGWIDDGGALKRRLSAANVSVSQDLSVNAAAADLSPAGLAIAFASSPGDKDAEALLRSLLAGSARIAVVMRGSLGSIASDGNVTAVAGIVPVPVIDSTGAGDTFIAAFLDAHLSGSPLQACLEAGRDRAAATLGHFGGFPQEA